MLVRFIAEVQVWLCSLIFTEQPWISDFNVNPPVSVSSPVIINSFKSGELGWCKNGRILSLDLGFVGPKEL